MFWPSGDSQTLRLATARRPTEPFFKISAEEPRPEVHCVS